MMHAHQWPYTSALRHSIINPMRRRLQAQDQSRVPVWRLRSASEPGGDDEAARINTAPRSDAVELSTKRGPPRGPSGGPGTYAVADSEDELWADTPPAADGAGARSGFGDGMGERAAEQDVLLRGGAAAGMLSEAGAAGSGAADATMHHDRALRQAPPAADKEQALHAASPGQPGGARAEHSQDGPGVT